MKEENPLENLFQQMGELLKLLESGVGKEINPDAIPVDIELKLNRLEKDVEAFKRMGDEAVALSGLSTVELRKRTEGMEEDLSPEGKALIEKAETLKKQASELKESYKTGTTPSQPAEKFVEDPKFGANRRKKFKRFGGDDKWKPL